MPPRFCTCGDRRKFGFTNTGRGKRQFWVHADPKCRRPTQAWFEATQKGSGG